MSGLIPAWVGGVLAPVDKLAVHLQGLRHQAVSVFVLAEGAVLIQRRALSKYHTPGLWANTCCTHPDWNEAPQDCATRRLGEELGISGLSPRHVDQIEYRADVGGGMTEHEVVDLFVAHSDRGLGLAPNPDEVMETRWITVADLKDEVKRDPHRFTPWLRIYLQQHGDLIFRAG